MRKPLLSVTSVLSLILFFQLMVTDRSAPDLATPQPEERLYPATQQPDRIVLTWSDDPATSQSVTWRTDRTVSNAFAKILPAEKSPPDADHARRVDAATKPMPWIDETDHYHSATFNGLEPGTAYVYRVGDGENWSEWHSFTTASADNDAFSFLYFGDIQNDIREFGSRTVRAAYSHFPDARFSVHAGDLTLSSGGDYSWGEWHATGGWIQSSVPQIPSPGNSDHIRLAHDDIDTRMLYPQWLAGFTLPDNGPEGLEGVTYYIDYQGVRVISLYSNFESVDYDRRILISEDIEVTEELIQRQNEWLEETLADNPNDWTVVTFHHPVHSAREDRENVRLRESWKPLFEKYQVDLVLQGHDHLYARGFPEETSLDLQDGETGPVYTISIAGPKMRPLDETGKALHWVDRSGENVQLYQIVHVESDQLTYESWTVTGELFDAFELHKQQEGRPNRFVDNAPADFTAGF